MELTQVWGALIIFVVCPLVGGLPLIAWITAALTGRKLAGLGTGNVSVSAAFYHGGRLAGILAVLSEAGKGIGAVLLARAFFPQDPAWELISLIALVMGRYWISKGAGTTNVVWGYVTHDPLAAGLVFVIGGIGFTLIRERRQGKIGILILFPLITALRHPSESALILTAIILGGLLGWIYTQVPDDLDLSPDQARSESQAVFKFFRSDRSLVSLDQSLKPGKVGQKAATLAQLKRWGYPVPPGWVLLPGDDAEPLITSLRPSPEKPLVVRSSAVDEDSDMASAAGQYETVLNVTSREELQQAISRCLASYDNPGAMQYRSDRGLTESPMAVLVQEQVQGVFSGVAFSRDPILRQGDGVLIEGLPGGAVQVVSGRVTPETYRVLVRESDLSPLDGENPESWVMPDDLTLEIALGTNSDGGAGNLPPRLIQQVAFLARHLEARYHGIPQDIEWSYDGQILWLLQSRPITTLLPIWTRKIAAEVIPGLIRPLTWSINRPLTCGVWGDLFTLVLDDRARGLDFSETATLHYSRAYFNASLLGQIFLRMGLPPESLEFLTRGSKFSKPPLGSTLRNVPGLLRLVGRELRLERDFALDYRHRFAPTLAELAEHPPTELPPSDLLGRIDTLLELLRSATYYSILAPLSAALRKGMFRVGDDQIDSGETPEVAALRSLQSLAHSGRQLLEHHPSNRLDGGNTDAHALLDALAQIPGGQELLQQLAELIDRYGYLSEVGTDIAVPTWKEDPDLVRELFTQFCLNPPPPTAPIPRPRGKVRSVQQRFDLKGKVTEVYSRLLAELRWSFLALEQSWLQEGVLQQPGDLFFLEFAEIQPMIAQPDAARIAQLVSDRRAQFDRDAQIPAVPPLVYGIAPPPPSVHNWQASQQLRGIGASPGQVEGRIRVLRSLQSIPGIDRETILVVPYTDSGWAPLLARAGGLIAEVGGQLSHGAIVAREYRIPAVMDIHNATRELKDGQWVRIDGTQGTVEIL